ncbi:MAG TPA: alpha-L-fucosidase, partial [Dysgonomonas sp.]|nr:alpha-L-fucosidase [Dysgonomonas sp.]
MKSKVFFLCMLYLAAIPGLRAQTFTHGKSDTYTYPKDEDVLEKLDKWQDQKFGMLIHYGLYSELGIIESWSLCNEDWINRDS